MAIDKLTSPITQNDVINKINEQTDKLNVTNVYFGTCSTEAATAEKTVTLTDATGFNLTPGTIIGVKFTTTNTATSVKLNVNGTGAKSIYSDAAVFTAKDANITGTANRTSYYMYDGTYWVFIALSGYWGNTYDRTYLSNSGYKAKTAITTQNLIVADSTGAYFHLKSGSAFDITYPMLFATSAVNAGAVSNAGYIIIPLTITTTQAITLTADKMVYVKGTLSGTTFTPVSTTPLTQTIPTTEDGYYYYLVGKATTTTVMYLYPEHPIYVYKSGAFREYVGYAETAVLKSGDTMTGQLKLQSGQYNDDGTNGALDCQNSNIIKVNSIYTADDAGNAQEGIHFYRTATTVDSIHAHNGELFFTPNRTLGQAGTSIKIAPDLSADLISKGYLNTHPENAPVILPFMNNDIAFLTKRGGTCVVQYDGVTQSINTDNIFDGSPSYLGMNPSNTTTITFELTLHKTFTYKSNIYVDFGNASWRAKYVKIDYMSTGGSEWVQCLNISSNSVGHAYVQIDTSSTGFNKLKFTFSDWNNATIFRIAQIGIYNYGSAGLREPFMSRGANDPVYRSITPATTNTYDLGSSSYKWNNIYGNLTGNVTGNVTGNLTGNVTGNANSATKLATRRGIDGILFDGTESIAHFATCNMTGSVYSVDITCSGFMLYAGSWIAIQFTGGGSSSSNALSLNINQQGGKNVKYYNDNNAIPADAYIFRDGRVYLLVYDGTDFRIVGDLDTASSYDAGTAQQLTDGTSEQDCVWTPKILHNYVVSMTGGGGQQTTWYGTCGTSAGTTAKSVTCANYILAPGAIIGILFTTANTASAPTLNINSTGAIAIRIGNSAPASTTNVLKWSANTMLYFMYDGTYYRYITARSAASTMSPDGGGTWYGSCSTAAGTADKVTTITNFQMSVGSLVAVRFSTANTVAGAITLNVNSTGAKTIYVKGAATSSSNPLLWEADTMLLFSYVVGSSANYYSLVGVVYPNTTTWTTPTVTDSAITISEGGYYTEGRRCYVQMRFKLASALSANSGRYIASAMPAPKTTSAAILSIAVNNRGGHNIRVVSDGRMQIVADVDYGITTSDDIDITGCYTIQ